jgi:hypothetical protein
MLGGSMPEEKWTEKDLGGSGHSLTEVLSRNSTRRTEGNHKKKKNNQIE